MIFKNAKSSVKSQKVNEIILKYVDLSKNKAIINTKTGPEGEKKNLIRRAHKNGGAPWLLSWKKQRPGLSIRQLLPTRHEKKASKSSFSLKKRFGSTPVSH